MAGASSTGAQTPTYDLVIRGGRIVDGTGAPSYRADLAVLNGRISVIGRPDTTKARRVIDATGLVVAPGSVSYTHLRAHETPEHLVCRLLLEKKKNNKKNTRILYN